MFDAKLRPLIDPPLNRIGRALATGGVTANMLTFLGLVLGLAGARKRGSCPRAAPRARRCEQWAIDLGFGPDEKVRALSCVS